MAEATAEKRSTLEDFDPQKKPKRNKYAFACAILASMTSILLGYGEFLFVFIQFHTACQTHAQYTSNQYSYQIYKYSTTLKITSTHTTYFVYVATPISCRVCRIIWYKAAN